MRNVGDQEGAQPERSLDQDFTVEVLDGGQVHQLPMQQRRGGGGGRSPAELREIRRLACLKAAATFCGGKALNTEVSTADLLKVAEALERWVVKGGEAARVIPDQTHDGRGACNTSAARSHRPVGARTMHQKSNPDQVAGLPTTDLVLERYGLGYAWVRPQTHHPEPRCYVMPSRYRLTDAGRRALAEEQLFGHPWPTVAEVAAS